jgi:hypothetical protein
MPSKSPKEIKPIDEKSVDFFIERLAEILLMQIEEKTIPQSSTKTNLQKGVVSESPKPTKPAECLVSK